MSGRTQRQRNAELDIRALKGQIGEVKGTVNVYLHDFHGRGGGVHESLTEDGFLIRIISHPYPEEAGEG